MLKDIKYEDYLFTEEDFDTFKVENQNNIHPDIMLKRKYIGEKLLDISKNLLPILLKRGYILDTHPKSGNTLSLDRPCQFNHGRVDWRGVRFGRTVNELDILNVGLGNIGYDSRKKIGFQKYTCFQIAVNQYGVDVGLFHAVPFESIDRMIVRDNLLNNEEFRVKLIQSLETIKGYGFTWNISPKPGETDDHIFNFDQEETNKFIKFYLDNDIEGTYSSLLYRLPKWDRRLLKDNILNSCLDIFDLLYPVYDVIK